MQTINLEHYSNPIKGTSLLLTVLLKLAVKTPTLRPFRKSHLQLHVYATDNYMYMLTITCTCNYYMYMVKYLLF